ncbi:M20 family metallopeptidase [Sporosarcina cascadiensis]|uniref:M20 family metallopeptidase n=1 Tax=Sporosarcina cascadiensis TaxID=2660747 RepID=UPI00129BFB03|nr:M20 family metallopeptidase [Sporosarcina cascadiensis]
MKQQLFTRLEDGYEEMIKLRRDFHMHPELSFQEVNTAKKIAEFQRRLGLEVQTNVGGHGVVATLRGKHPGKTIAVRADFDALPIQEENDVPYKSTNPGVMHACGHDAHTAIALGLSKALVAMKDDIAGNIVFIHQHAEEEDPGGAKPMIEAGALDGVDVIFATHMENYIPVDHVLYSENYILGACDDFTIEIIGSGGHGAFPQDTVDVIALGGQLIGNLHQITSRKVDPLKSAVLSIGSFHAGEAANVIPERAILKGTIRTFDEDVRQSMYEWLKTITTHTCQAFGATHELEYMFGYPATKNDPGITKLLVNAAKEVLPVMNIQEMQPNMGAEDFSYFLQNVPGTYFFTGSANEEKGFIYPYHHPKFDIDEKALLNGAKVIASSMVDYWEMYNA